MEEARAAALVLAAQQEGRELEAAREAEVDRALARVVGLCSGVEEVGTVLAFSFWAEGGALTPVGYQQERGSGRVGRTTTPRVSPPVPPRPGPWRSGRKALRPILSSPSTRPRLERAIQQPLGVGLKGTLRDEARAYYAKLYPQFARVLDELQSELPIHHRRPLQYAHLFPAENINAAENLAMLRKSIHEQINVLWGRFRKARPNPTADEVRRAAELIDEQFAPWYHRVDNPPGLLKTAEQARDTALRELRSQFPGLE